MHLFGGYTIYSSDKVAYWIGPVLFLKFYYINCCKYLTMNVMKVVFKFYCNQSMFPYVN